MKRFMGLALILFGAGLALVLYAVLFGPKEYKSSLMDNKVPVGEIQYNNATGTSPQQPWVESKSGATQPAPSQPEASEHR